LRIIVELMDFRRIYEIVVYDYKGTVSCFCPETGKQREMCNGGFEKDRNTLKKLFPAVQMEIQCEGKETCPVVQGLRIPLTEHRRIFTPIGCFIVDNEF